MEDIHQGGVFGKVKLRPLKDRTMEAKIKKHVRLYKKHTHTHTHTHPLLIFGNQIIYHNLHNFVEVRCEWTIRSFKVVIDRLLFVLFQASLYTAFHGFVHGVRLQYSFHEFSFSFFIVVWYLVFPRNICFCGIPVTLRYFSFSDTVFLER